MDATDPPPKASGSENAAPPIDWPSACCVTVPDPKLSGSTSAAPVTLVWVVTDDAPKASGSL